MKSSQNKPFPFDNDLIKGSADVTLAQIESQMFGLNTTSSLINFKIITHTTKRFDKTVIFLRV